MLNGFKEYQRILVLGGNSDLAVSILHKVPIAEAGEVILCSRHNLKQQTLALREGIQIRHVEIDFTQLQRSETIIENVFKTGDIDLVIIAYATLGNEDLQLQRDIFSEVLFTNFYSQALLLNQINSFLVTQMHGQILLISSVAGIRPRKVNFVYGVSKFGVDFIAQGLQKHNVGKNVFITILRPGFVDTKMTRGLSPAPFATSMLRVGEIANKALRDRKPIVYAPRILLFVMFILKALPERVFRIIDN
jgi:decaprenylphospho-beta-D-erythro-pentofuranosid-2-ulose 2-reductase